MLMLILLRNETKEPTNPNANHVKETQVKATKSNVDVECGVSSVDCGLYSGECKVWSVDCGL